MTTLAAGSRARISLRAARPSFSGMVMSSVMMSGLELLEALDGLDAVAGFADHLVAALGERVADHLPHERGVVDDEHACHQSVPPSVVVSRGRWRAGSRSMRTAQSLSSMTRSRPVAKRMPLTYRSIGIVGAGGRARRPRPAAARRRADGHARAAELGPDAHGDAGAATARRRTPGTAAVAGRAAAASALELVQRARHAHDEGVGDELHQPARLAADGEGDADRVRASARTRRPASLGRLKDCVSGGADLDLGAEHGRWWRPRRRPSSGSSPRRRRRARARDSSLGSSAGVGLRAHHRRGQARAPGA